MSVLTIKPEDLLKLVVTRAGLPKILVDPEEAAEVLSVSRSTVYQLMESQQLRSVHIGRRRLIPWSALEAFADRAAAVGTVALTNEPQE